MALTRRILHEKIIFSANSMSGKTGDSSSTTELNGNAYILTETMEISADTITLSGDDLSKFTRMVDALEDLDDVQNVYHNVDLPDEF